MWLAITKAIWTQRNRIIFDGGQVDEIEISVVAQLYAWSWVKFGGFRLRGNFLEWCIHSVDCLREVR